MTFWWGLGFEVGFSLEFWRWGGRFGALRRRWSLVGESVPASGQGGLGGYGRAGRGQGAWCASDRGAPGIGSH